MPETTTTFDAVLKDMFIGPVRETLNEEVFLFNQANSKPVKSGGRRVLFPVHTNRNWAVGSRAERGTLPTAQEETYVTATVPRQHWYARIELSAQVMKSSQGDRAAFAAQASESFERMTRNSKKYFNRSLWVGSTGELMRFSNARATQTTNTYTITSSVAAGVTPRGNPLRFIEEDMVLDGITNGSATAIPTTTYATDLTSATVSSATIAASGTATIVFSATVTVVSGTMLVHTGTAGQDFLGVEEGIETSGTYTGVNRDTRDNRAWRGNVLANGGTLRDLTLDLIQTGWDSVSEASGRDDAITHLLAHYSVRREYLSLLSPDVRFQALNLEGGHKVLSFNGVPFRFEVDIPYHTIFGLSMPSWNFYKWTDFEWADEDGAVLHRVANIDSFEAFIRIFGNFSTDMPNHNFRITDVNATL